MQELGLLLGLERKGLKGYPTFCFSYQRWTKKKRGTFNQGSIDSIFQIRDLFLALGLQLDRLTNKTEARSHSTFLYGTYLYKVKSISIVILYIKDI